MFVKMTGSVSLTYHFLVEVHVGPGVEMQEIENVQTYATQETDLNADQQTRGECYD
jgi:hypothetical protein